MKKEKDSIRATQHAISANYSLFVENLTHKSISEFIKRIPWIPTKLSQGEGLPSVDYKFSDKKVNQIYIAILGHSYIASIIVHR